MVIIQIRDRFHSSLNLATPKLQSASLCRLPDLVEACEKGQLKGKLKDIAAGLDEEANPVIMLAKYKK